jgi:dihydroorotate dehydrogenase
VLARMNCDGVEKLVISAPFGEWFHWDYTTSTLGTYTATYRAGRLKRLWRVLSTVRPYPAIRAWVNKLGLPNPGIDHLIRRNENGLCMADKMVSISARDDRSWAYLLTTLKTKARGLQVVEMNVSCPNCPGEPDTSNYQKVFQLAVEELKLRVSVKLPPIGYESMAETAIAGGIHYLHCCNTLPTPAGGMSGKPLQALSLAACRFCAKLSNDRVIIIGGGGITDEDDIRRYRNAGATRFAVGSALFNPWRWTTIPALAWSLAHTGN